MNVIAMSTHLEPNQKTNEMIQSVSKVQEQEPQVTNDENSNFNTDEISYEDFFNNLDSYNFNEFRKKADLMALN